MRLKCQHCGHETVISVTYCPSCGEKMPVPAAAAEEPSAAEPSPDEPTAGPEPESPAEAAAAAAPPESSVVTMPPSVTEPATTSAPPPGAPTPVAAPPTPQPPGPAAAPPPATAQAPPRKGRSAWWWVCGGCGCLVIVIGIIAAIGGLAFIGKRAVKPAATEVEQSATTADEGEGLVPSEAGGQEAAGDRVATDHYVVTVPAGWAKDQETGGDVLRLLGPAVNGQQLDLQISVEELAEDVSLQGFSDGFLEQYAGIARTEDTYEAGLCDEPARRVAFTTDGHDYLVYLSVYKAQGFIVVMIAPEGTMGAEESTFDQVLDEFAMYE